MKHGHDVKPSNMPLLQVHPNYLYAPSAVPVCDKLSPKGVSIFQWALAASSVGFRARLRGIDFILFTPCPLLWKLHGK